MVEIIDPEGITSLRDEEINSERSAITSALAGVASGIIKVPEGVYNGTQLATALQDRINQMEDSTGNTVNGVTVVYNTNTNSFTFTTGTTGIKSKIFYTPSHGPI